MSLTVKAFLKKEGTSGEQEIRRFTVDQDVSTNFIYLTKKLVLVYPALQDKTFHLRWKDSENDLVLFSSDEELTQALGFVDDGVFKIYIEEVQAESGPKPSGGSSTHCGNGGPQNVFHPGVKCDGCEGPVYGTRFKCQTCPNFDLCGGCRQTGLHGEHAFDDIHAPTNPFNMFEGHMEGGFQAMPQLWFQGGMTPPMFHHWGQDPNEDQRRGAPWHGGCRATRKAWRKWYREMYNDYEKKGKKHGHKHGCTHDSEKKKAENMEAETSGEPSTAEKDTAREAEPEKKHDDDVEESSSDEGEGGEGEGGEGGEAPEGYLRTIGKSVTDFLKPFGIDVEAFVKTQGGEGAHHHGPTSGGPHHSHFGPHGGPFGPHCRPYGPRGFGPRGGCHGPERGSFRYPRGSFGPRGGAFGPHGAPWSNEFSGRGGPFFGRGGPFGGRGGPFGGRGGSCRPESFGPHGGPSGHPAGGQFRCHFGQFGHEGGQWGPYNMGPQDTPCDPGTSTSDATGSQGQGAGQGHQSTDSAEQQNKMDQDAPPNAGDAARETGEEGSATSSHLPQNSDELLIAEVVNTMKGMGFGDDGGWLTTLVRAHGGDMGRALDAIHATRQN